jgi:hypothetical protein
MPLRGIYYLSKPPRRRKMSPKLKRLATSVVWILFVFGVLRLVIGLIYAFASKSGAPPTHAFYDFGIGVASLILAVVALKIRRSLE